MKKLFVLAVSVALGVTAIPALAATKTVKVDDNVFSPKVIAQRAPATASGVQASPSRTSTPPAPLSASAIARRRVRRSVMRPWSSPWIR